MVGEGAVEDLPGEGVDQHVARLEHDARLGPRDLVAVMYPLTPVSELLFILPTGTPVHPATTATSR